MGVAKGIESRVDPVIHALDSAADLDGTQPVRPLENRSNTGNFRYPGIYCANDERLIHAGRLQRSRGRLPSGRSRRGRGQNLNNRRIFFHVILFPPTIFLP